MRTCKTCGETKPESAYRKNLTTCRACWVKRDVRRQRQNRTPFKCGECGKRIGRNAVVCAECKQGMSMRDQFQVAAFKTQFKIEMNERQDAKLAFALALTATSDDMFNMRVNDNPDMVERWNELSNYQRA